MSFFYLVFECQAGIGGVAMVLMEYRVFAFVWLTLALFCGLWRAKDLLVFDLSMSAGP